MWLSPAFKDTVALFLLTARYFDVQGHRGSRGEVVESTLPAFAWGFIDGVTTLELDNGITKDGIVVAWHDEEIIAEKCVDTSPVTKDDPDFPYVGKHVVNLTLAQLKTLDCGANRLAGYPLQLTYPGTPISTMEEVFDFAKCVDAKREMNWNIESKINPIQPNATRGVEDFVTLQHQIFTRSGYQLSQITYQSFDWRTLIAMKDVDSRIPTAALIDYETLYGPNKTKSQWHAGLSIDTFDGHTVGERIANAAKFIGASILSPAAVSEEGTSLDPAVPGYIPFTTKEMVAQAHKVGVAVKPWTVNRLNIGEQILQWGVDGIITDYPAQIRRLVQQQGRTVAPKFPKKRVLDCLRKHIQTL